MSKYIKNNKKLYSQWNFEKNKDLDPSTLLSGSNNKVWRKCEKGHEWEAFISSRNHGVGCPKCTNHLKRIVLQYDKDNKLIKKMILFLQLQNQQEYILLLLVTHVREMQRQQVVIFGNTQRIIPLIN